MKNWIQASGLALLLTSASAYAGNTSLDREAKAIGAKQCLTAIKTHADRTIEAASHEADMSWNSEQPDTHLLSYFVSKGRFDGDTQVNMLFVPNLAGGCDTVITETFVAQKQCAIFQETKLPDWKSRGLLNRRTIVLQGKDNRVNIYLTPAGVADDLCIVTRREVGFS
jgi:hypothetical protein